MKRILTAAAALILVFTFAACAAAPVAEPTPAPNEAVAATPTATPEPTAEPTPSPTPEPVFTETSLNQVLFTGARVTVTATGLRFSENYITYIDLSVQNEAAVNVSLALDGLCLNDWQVDGALMDAQDIVPGETRAVSAVVSWLDDPNAAYMNLSSIANFSLDLSVLDSASNAVLAKKTALGVSLPDAQTSASPAEGTTLVYDDNSISVYLQGIDGSLQNTRVLLYKKPGAKWMSVTVNPVYAGYMNIINHTYPMSAGKYRLLAIDGTDVMSQQNISQLAQLDLYLLLNQFDGRINRPVIASITDPNVAETVVNAPDAGPIVYQSELSYFILRNMGVTTYDGHEALLFDFENITQNYIKTLDITAYSDLPKMSVDGTAYPIATYCTYSFPGTHGYILIWPEGAPEGTLSNASSVSLRLKVSRINGGHFDPIVDTNTLTIDLKP